MCSNHVTTKQNKMARIVQISVVFLYLLAFCRVDISVALERLVPDHARVHKFSMDTFDQEIESHTVNKRSTRQKRESGDATCQLQKQNFLSKVKPEDLIDKVLKQNSIEYDVVSFVLYMNCLSLNKAVWYMNCRE